MKRRGRVFRVRSKPSKQPLGLVARGVPIEKVRAKRAMHSDWARGVAGAWSRRRREAAPGEVQLQKKKFSPHIRSIPPLEDHQWSSSTGGPLSADFQFGSIFSSRDPPLAEVYPHTYAR